MAGGYGIRPYGYDPGAFRRRSPPRRPEGWPPYNPLSRLCVGRGALTPPQVHVAVRFPFSHRPQHQLQPVLSPAEIRGGVPALEHPRQGRVSQMAPAQRVAPLHKTVC